MGNYSKALKEVYVILDYIDEKEKNKIPKEMLEVIEENMDKEYNFELDKKVSLSNQKLLNETLGIISVLYSRYICDDEEKEKWKEYDRYVLAKTEELKKKQYVEKDLFKKKSLG